MQGDLMHLDILIFKLYLHTLMLNNTWDLCMEYTRTCGGGGGEKKNKTNMDQSTIQQVHCLQQFLTQLSKIKPKKTASVNNHLNKHKYTT